MPAKRLAIDHTGQLTSVGRMWRRLGAWRASATASAVVKPVPQPGRVEHQCGRGHAGNGDEQRAHQAGKEPGREDLAGPGAAGGGGVLDAV